jgi:hypothetical protein
MAFIAGIEQYHDFLKLCTQNIKTKDEFLIFHTSILKLLKLKKYTILVKM